LQPVPFGSAALQLSDVSLHDAEQFPSDVFSGRHGSPACVEHAPDEHVSLPLQNAPSLHAAPLGSEAVQLSDASLQDSAQFESPSGPGHGLPACPVHAPEAHVSAPLQNNPSLQAVPLGSVALQLSDVSLHDAAQFESVVVSGRHGSPTCPVQAPLEQVSAPLQNKPSLHADPFVSAAVQLSEASLHDSEQFESPSGPGHGLPACAVQAPDEQVSAPLQNNPSLQTVPFGSLAVQLSDASLHEPAQLESVVFSGRHGSPTCDEHVPPEHVSAPLQNRPSVHADPFGSAAVQLSAASLHDSEQLPSPSGPAARVAGMPAGSAAARVAPVAEQSVVAGKRIVLVEAGARCVADVVGADVAVARARGSRGGVVRATGSRSAARVDGARVAVVVAGRALHVEAVVVALVARIGAIGAARARVAGMNRA
jgi:hypothetical protein